MKKVKYNLFYLLLFAFVAFVACDAPTPEKRNLDSDQLQRPGELIAESFPDTRDQLQEEMQKALEILEDKIEELEEKKAEAEAEVEAEIDEKLHSLNELRKSINADMKKLGENIEDNWDEFNQHYDWEDFSEKVREKILTINRIEV